jgi:hypothetical protein
MHSISSLGAAAFCSLAFKMPSLISALAAFAAAETNAASYFIMHDCNVVIEPKDIRVASKVVYRHSFHWLSHLLFPRWFGHNRVKSSKSA